jgi:hypothetical protein
VSKQDKRLEAMRRNPRQVPFDEMESVLVYFGFVVRKASGSHRMYRLGSYVLTVARHGQFAHPQAVKDALKILDEIIDNN